MVPGVVVAPILAYIQVNHRLGLVEQKGNTESFLPKEICSTAVKSKFLSHDQLQANT